MNLFVEGGTAKQRSLIEKAAAFFLNNLLQKKSDEDFEIVIALRRDLFKRNGTKADCCIDNDDDSRMPTVFEIRIDSRMNNQALLRSLAHECVHISQWRTGMLRESKSEFCTSYWNGKKYRTAQEDYWDMPWEVDAYGREIGLVERFVESAKLQNTRWYKIDYDFT